MEEKIQDGGSSDKPRFESCAYQGIVGKTNMANLQSLHRALKALSPLWKRVIAWVETSCPSDCGKVWGDVGPFSVPPNNPTIAWTITLDPGHHSFSKWASRGVLRFASSPHPRLFRFFALVPISARSNSEERHVHGNACFAGYGGRGEIARDR